LSGATGCSSTTSATPRAHLSTSTFTDVNDELNNGNAAGSAGLVATTGTTTWNFRAEADQINNYDQHPRRRRSRSFAARDRFCRYDDHQQFSTIVLGHEWRFHHRREANGPSTPTAAPS
jgi:hypothetical protein